MKKIENFEFPAPVGKGTHDWATILNGDQWQLEEGKDYECKTATFASLARAQAKKRGMTIRSGKVDGGIVIQAEKASKEQLAKWAAAEAAEKSEAAEGNAEEATPPVEEEKSPPAVENPGKKKRGKK